MPRPKLLLGVLLVVSSFCPAALAADTDKRVRPVRVLLFADVPTREYQFVRYLLLDEVKQKRAELSICLQSAVEGTVQDVPAERLFKDFPSRLQPIDEDKGATRFANLAQYDAVIAFDPDWAKVPAEDLQLLRRWVERGGGLILVAGPMHTGDLVKKKNAAQVKPLLDLLPVVLDDDRRIVYLTRPTDKAWPLRFSRDAAKTLLRLDPEGEDALAGWSEFFYGKPANEVQPADPVLRGFYRFFPAENVKSGATVLASFGNPDAKMQDKKPQPYLVTSTNDKGRVTYLASDETWRVRLFHEAYYQQLWISLIHHAMGLQSQRPEQPGIHRLSPAERKALDRCLAWLAKQQDQKGNWHISKDDYKTSLTAMAGLALAMNGSTLRDGPHAKELRRAVDWLLHPSRNAAIGDLRTLAELAESACINGLGMLFFASIYGEEEDLDRRTALAAALRLAVETAKRGQDVDGGWGYSFDATVANPTPTLLQLEGLRAVQQAGIPVPREMLAKAEKYLCDAVEEPAELLPAAAAGLGPEFFATPAARKWIRGAKRSVPASYKTPGDIGMSWWRVLHARLAWELGDSGYVRLFADSKPEERFSWGGYRGATFPHLLRSQRADGSWGLYEDRIHESVLNLIIMQLECNAVPAYRR